MFSSELFFIVTGALGLNYEGGETSNVYLVYLIVYFILMMLLFIQDLTINKTMLTVKNIIILFIILFIFVLFGVDMILNGLGAEMITRFTYFIVWGVSSFFGAIYLSKNKRFEGIIYFIDIFLILTNIALIRSVLNSLFNNNLVSLGGATYQTAGYVFALAFGLTLYLIVFGHNHTRFKFAEKNHYKFLNFGFLIIQMYGVISTGARGAMILIIYYVFLMLIMSINDFKSISKYLLLFGILSFIVVLTWPIISDNALIQQSWNRIFSYIGEGGIDWGGTSGRDTVYQDAFALIAQRPVLGYGLFNFYNVSVIPHNLFLEIMLQGGLIYLFLFLIMLILFFIKFYRLMINNKNYLIYFVIFSYPFVMLMFSGSYLSNATFLFMIAFIFIFNPVSRQHK